MNTLEQNSQKILNICGFSHKNNTDFVNIKFSRYQRLFQLADYSSGVYQWRVHWWLRYYATIASVR